MFFWDLDETFHQSRRPGSPVRVRSRLAPFQHSYDHETQSLPEQAYSDCAAQGRRWFKLRRWQHGRINHLNSCRARIIFFAMREESSQENARAIGCTPQQAQIVIYCV
jgi:hypothetical protein